MSLALIDSALRELISVNVADPIVDGTSEKYPFIAGREGISSAGAYNSSRKSSLSHGARLAREKGLTYYEHSSFRQGE